MKLLLGWRPPCEVSKNLVLLLVIVHFLPLIMTKKLQALMTLASSVCCSQRNRQSLGLPRDYLWCLQKSSSSCQKIVDHPNARDSDAQVQISGPATLNGQDKLLECAYKKNSMLFQELGSFSRVSKCHLSKACSSGILLSRS